MTVPVATASTPAFTSPAATTQSSRVSAFRTAQCQRLLRRVLVGWRTLVYRETTLRGKAALLLRQRSEVAPGSPFETSHLLDTSSEFVEHPLYSSVSEMAPDPDPETSARLYQGDRSLYYPNAFYTAIYLDGCDPSSRGDMWKCLLHQYPSVLAPAERAARDLQIQTAYSALLLEANLALESENVVHEMSLSTQVFFLFSFFLVWGLRPFLVQPS